MFRKPKKRAAKAGMRRQKSHDSDGDDEKAEAVVIGVSRKSEGNGEDDEEESTSVLLSEARKRTKLTAGKFSTTAPATTTTSTTASGGRTTDQKKSVMHEYATSSTNIRQRNADLVTSSVEHHPESEQQKHNTSSGTAEMGDDGIFRDKTRSKLLAGPIKVTTSIRTTTHFDYNPEICKDYKETGFCGYGDTCIYLHDRGDTLSGWQLEKQWEEEQRRKKEQQERVIQGFVDGKGNKDYAADDDEEKKMAAALGTADGLPYACHICRKPFTNPVVTSCGHYFCEACIMNRVRTESSTCPICSKDTHGVFNQPTKLINKKRKILGAAEARKENSWAEYAKAVASKQDS